MEASSNFPVHKIGNRSSDSNYRLISLLNNFYTLIEFVIHGQVLHYLKFKISF
jgi:hypothetical protein